MIQHSTLQELNNPIYKPIYSGKLLVYWFISILTNGGTLPSEFFFVWMADETVFLAPCTISSFQFQMQLTVACFFLKQASFRDHVNI
jgi:hypothetical protein